MSSENEEVKDFLITLRRVGFSLILLVIFILGKWFISWLLRITITSDNGSIAANLLDWVEELGIAAVAIMWGVHVLAEMFLFIRRHIS